ncbi:MAG: VWA domain-containing protein, partial [Anaerolineales bacterium]
RPIEAFVFSTQLTHITPHLRSRDVERAVAEITRSVPDWSGGTRIGKSLKRFNFYWARRVLGRGAVVLLISDGWDRGDIELLGREMAWLQRRSHRLIWLNPLLGSPLYEPLTMGLQAALPFVDDFLPIHNLESLEQLAAELDRLGPRRPSRRQQRSEFNTDGAGLRAR